MIQPAELAGQLLRFEQQLNAYQKLHEDELKELWQTLNECKRAITDLVDERTNETDAANAGASEEV